MENLNVIAPINFLGYGNTGYELSLALSKLYKVALWPIGPIDREIPEHVQPVIQEMINNQADFDVNAPSLKIWHQFDMAQSVGRGLRIGFPIFELNKFNEREMHQLRSLDRIFVCSHWAKEIIAKEVGNIETHVVPLGVDRSIFFDTPVRKDVAPYVFMNIGKWEIRKGHDILVTAFNNAFNKEDNVELWMMNHNPFLKPEQEKDWHDFYKHSKLWNKIKLLPRVNSQKDVSNLMRQAHCGVFPSRAEGFNLELLEMMSCGRPVITTDYSAHTEFANADNSNLIKISETEEAFDSIWFHGQGEWAKLGDTEIDKLSSLMIKCFKQGSVQNTAGVNTAARFSWDAAAEAVRKGLQ